MAKKEIEEIGSCLKDLLVNKKIQVNKIITFGSVIISNIPIPNRDLTFLTE